MGLRAPKILSALCGVSYYATHIRPEKILRRSQFVSEVLILNLESIVSTDQIPSNTTLVSVCWQSKL